MQYILVTERAKIIKELLKTQYPGTKFSVKSDVIGSGDSVSVQWELGPTKKGVEGVIKKAALEYEANGITLQNVRNKLVTYTRILTDEAVSVTMDKLLNMYTIRGWNTANIDFECEAIKMVESTSYFRDVKQKAIEV